MTQEPAPGVTRRIFLREARSAIASRRSAR